VHRRTGLAPRRLSRTTRIVLIAAHSVGASLWLGVLLVLGLADLAELRSHTGPGVLDGLAGVYIAWLLIPTVALVLCTGLILAACSAWGLVRHWWLLGKITLAGVLSCYGLAAMLVAVHTRYDRLAAAIALTSAVAVSVLKPWGRTPFATRPGRRESDPRPAGLRRSPPAGSPPRT
jgi:hypothetical protein